MDLDQVPRWVYFISAAMDDKLGWSCRLEQVFVTPHRLVCGVASYIRDAVKDPKADL